LNEIYTKINFVPLTLKHQPTPRQMHCQNNIVNRKLPDLVIVIMLISLFSCKKNSSNPADFTTKSGYIYTIAGTGVAGQTGNGGPASSAAINATGIAVDAAGIIYISDYHANVVRKISGGIISVFAGNGGTGPTGDGGPATAASFDEPYQLACDNAGNVYVCDELNNLVRIINASGIINTFAGSKNGSLGLLENVPAIDAQIIQPSGVAADTAGNVYISQFYEGRVRFVNPSGIINTIADLNGMEGYSGDGGMAVNAKIKEPQCVATDNKGNIYFADYGNQVIRVIDANGIIRTFAGNGSKGYGGDGGPATQALLNNPTTIAADNFGNVYIGDVYNQRIRKVDANGIITTFAGNGTAGYSGDGGPASNAQLNYTSSLAVDAAGNVYIADNGNNRVRRVNK